MKRIIKLTESDLKRIIKRVINESNDGNIIQGFGNDPYQYRSYNNLYFFAKKGPNPKWIQSKTQKGIDAIKQKFSEEPHITDKYTGGQPGTPNTFYKKDGTGNDPYQYAIYNEKVYYAKKGPNPKWILVKDEEVKKTIRDKFKIIDPMQDWKSSNTQLYDKNKNKKHTEKSFDPLKIISPLLYGFKNWVRRTFPNVVQLFFARDLSEKDFSNSQLNIIKKVVDSAIKRTGKIKNGSTEYEDYGDDIVEKWFGPGGVKTEDMLKNTIMANPKFMIATTLGRFSYKVENGKLIVTDVYDFKKIPDAKTKPEDLEGLTFPQKVKKVMDDNDVNPYVAIRHLGYLENPEESPSSKPQIKIEIPLETTT